MKSKTYTHEGIEAAMKLIQQGSKSGSRYGDQTVRQIMIVLTDGQSTRPDKTQYAAARFRKVSPLACHL